MSVGAFVSSMKPVDWVVAGSQLLTSGTILYSIAARPPLASMWFAWHPRLAVLGASCAVTAAWLMANKKLAVGSNRLMVHQCLLGTGNAALLGALYVIYTNKNMHNRQHFQTLHSWLGLLSVLATSVLSIGTLTYMNMPQKGDEKQDDAAEKRNKLFGYHKLVGKCALSAMTIAVITGTLTTFGKVDAIKASVSAGAIAGLVGVIAIGMKLI